MLGCLDLCGRRCAGYRFSGRCLFLGCGRLVSWADPRQLCQECLLRRMGRLLLSTALGGCGCLWLGRHWVSTTSFTSLPCRLLLSTVVGMPPSPDGPATLVHGICLGVPPSPDGLATLVHGTQGVSPFPAAWRAVVILGALFWALGPADQVLMHVLVFLVGSRVE